MNNKTLVERICKVVGGHRRLAVLLNISEQAISKWKRNGIPVERVLAIEEATNEQITRQEMRPDIYPPETA